MNKKLLIVFTSMLVAACSQPSLQDKHKIMKLQQWQQDTQIMENQLWQELYPKRSPADSQEDLIKNPHDILSALRKSCEISGHCEPVKQLKSNARLPAYNARDALRNSQYFLIHKGMIIPERQNPEPEPGIPAQ